MGGFLNFKFSFRAGLTNCSINLQYFFLLLVRLFFNSLKFLPEHSELVDLCLAEYVQVEADPDEGKETAQRSQHQSVQLQTPPKHSEPEYLKFLGAQESSPSNKFRQPMEPGWPV